MAIEHLPELHAENAETLDITEVRKRLKEYDTLCPRCFKTLDERHIKTLLLGLDAIALAPDHLAKLSAKDFCCVECFDE